MQKRADTLVLFDVDGTLVNSMPLEAECFPVAVRAHLGIGEVSTDWESYEATTDPGVMAEIYERHLGREPTLAEIGAFVDVYVGRLAAAIARDRSKCAEIPGAKAALAHLRRRSDLALGIATGGWRMPAHLKLASAGVSVDGLPFASADETSDRAAILSLALARAEGPFERCVLVGDAVWDAAAARSLGMSFLGVACGADAARLKEAGAIDVIEDFRGLDRFVACLTGALAPCLG